MVRMRSGRDFRAQPPRHSAITVIFVGPIGRGVGVAADILSSVAELSQRHVTRDRRVASRITPTSASHDGFLQIVRMEDDAVERRFGVEAESSVLMVAWNVEAAMAHAHLLKSPDDLVLLETGPVPAWRRDLNCASPANSRGRDEVRPAGIIDAVRALGMLSLRLPFARNLWRHIVPQHVPARHGDAAMAHFLAAAR